MSKKSNRHLGTLKGSGKVYQAGKHIADVSYILRISQTFINIGGHTGEEELPGRKDIRGELTVLEGERNLIDNDRLSLELEDGRHWVFFATSGNPVSANYQVVNADSEGLTDTD